MILVTGGSGFVGTALLPALVARGIPVRVLTRRSVPIPGVESHRGDLLDPVSLTAAVRDVGAVIHLAVALGSSPLGAADILRTNVEGTANLAAAAAKAGVRQFVHVSSAGVYGDGMDVAPRNERTPPRPYTTYQRSKLESEDAVAATLRDTGVSWIVFRPTEIDGPGRQQTLRLYQNVLHRRVWVHGPPRLIVHPTYVGDLVNALLLALERPVAAGLFNIAGAEALTYPELIERIARRLHVRVRQVQLPAQPTRLIAKIAMNLTTALGRPVPSFERVQRPIINRSVDVSRARSVLGFEPCPLDEAIDATIAWGRREGRV
jgi:nucleoside-diphosphate-sugar epimerase